MSGVEMTRLLGEMQRLAATADARPTEVVPESGGFAELLKSSINAVNEAQTSAADMAAAGAASEVEPPAVRRQTLDAARAARWNRRVDRVIRHAHVASIVPLSAW